MGRDGMGARGETRRGRDEMRRGDWDWAAAWARAWAVGSCWVWVARFAPACMVPVPSVPGGLKFWCLAYVAVVRTGGAGALKMEGAAGLELADVGGKKERPERRHCPSGREMR